jgi:hypothetical protein
MSHTKIHYFQLPINDMVVLSEFFENTIDKNKKRSIWFNWFQKQKNKVDFEEIVKISGDAQKIVDISLRYLDIHGFQCEEVGRKNWYLELQRYKCVENDKTPLDFISLHKDDGSTTDYNVNTIVFYLEKSEKIIGGDLLVKINDKETIIPVMSGMAIAFRGNLLHTPIPCLGEGFRKTIVFQVERKE